MPAVPTLVWLLAATLALLAPYAILAGRRGGRYRVLPGWILAWTEFSILLESHPEYTAGYFMAAQTLVRAERSAEAKTMLLDGIASARRTGNLHAQSEMEAMLAELG